MHACEYRKKLWEYDEAKQQKAKLFDVRALAANTRKAYMIEDADLGIIRYGLLTSGEVRALELDKCSSDAERAEKVVFAMLKKANPDLAYEDYEALPFDVKTLLVARLSGVCADFLQRLQQTGLALGSALAQKPS